MPNTLLCQLLTKIQWFSIIADETRDVSNSEQLSIIIRWVDDDYIIHEDFIGMVHVPDTTASTLTTVIKDELICCALPLSNCRDQGV